MKFLLRFSLLCLISAILLGIFNKTKEPDTVSIVNTVQKNIESEVTHFNETEKKVSHFLSSNHPKFSDFLKGTTPVTCFVYNQNKQPVFWNDPISSPPENCLNIMDSLTVTSQPNGLVLYRTKKITLKDKFFYICLYKYLKYSYPIQNKYVNTHLAPELFPPGVNDISQIEFISNLLQTKTISFLNQKLFFIQIKENNPHSIFNNILTILWMISIGGLYFYQFFLFTKNTSSSSGFRPAKLISVLGSFLLIRSFMLGFNFPYSQTEWELFNPAHFALNSLIPSLGDLALTILLLLPMGWMLITEFLKLNFLKNKNEFLLPALLMLCLISLMVLDYYMVMEIQSNPLTSLHIREELPVNYFLITALFIEAFTVFFIWMVFLKILPELFILLPVLNRISQNRIWFFFSFLIFMAWLHTLAVSYADKKIQKINLANNLFIENDFLAEYYLNQAGTGIGSDLSIQNKFLRPTIQEDYIIDKIKSRYLNRYFDKYEVEVRVYRKNGSRVRISSPENYNEVLNDSKKDWIPTEYDGLFFQSSRLIEKGKEKAYRYFLTMTSVDSLAWPYLDKNIPAGFIIINLRLNKGLETSIMPRLFYDEKFSDTNHSPIHHEQTGLSEPLAKFSFYFIFLGIILTGLFLLLNKILKNSHYDKIFVRFHSPNTFSFRVQIYLLVASFFPLLIVLFTSVSITLYSHKSELLETISRKAENLSSRISILFDNYSPGTDEFNNLNQELMKYQNISGLDINLFDTNGMFVSSTQPLLFQLNLKPPYVNPLSISAFQEKSENKIVINETIEKLHFTGIYLKLISPRTGLFSGIVYIPYLASEEEISKELASVVSTILIIYVPVFILLIIFGNLFSKQLVIPLKLLSNSLQEISLIKINIPLKWKSDDEIGKLVKQYNDMLEKLEESKQKLSKNERELAWKEVAQKVAHEIKNPLTPMRLNLQHLERAIRENHPDVLKLTNKVIATLITQVDIINGIASSFSKIAKLPSSDLQIVNLEKIINEQASVFIQSKQATISIHTDKVDFLESEFMVIADPKELAGMFSNLLLNAIQAVTPDVFPVIEITLSNKEGKIYVCIKDNGKGMEDDTSLHAFEQGFTTKEKGSGIGLSLCKKIVENYEGKIWFETAPGRGTTFHIILAKV